MASESLSAVVLDVLKQNRKVGKSVVDAYRTGGTRLIEKNLSSRLGTRGKKVTGLLVKGIGKASDGAERALDTVCDQATKAVESVAAKVNGVENQYAAKYFDLVGKITLPSAKIARNLSTKIAAGTAKVYKSPAKTVAHKSTRKAVKRSRAA
jgi:hypothetical protein